MKRRFRLLSLVVQSTALLLAIAATLIVVGIFNESLNWDLFGPRLEAILYGVFGACVALAAVGVALSVVLGIQEIVKAFRAIQKHHEPENPDSAPEVTRGAYAKSMVLILAALSGLIGLLALINGRVLEHRTEVFKRIADEQILHFESKLAALIPQGQPPPRSHVNKDLYDLINTLDGLSFVQRTTLYLPDSADKSALWGYTAWREYRAADGFARFYVIKEFEKAMAAALEGQGADLNRLNDQTGFTRYHVLHDGQMAPVGILRIDGNSRENFREYRLGS